jgi:hypothetical protein
LLVELIAKGEFSVSDATEVELSAAAVDCMPKINAPETSATTTTESRAKALVLLFVFYFPPPLIQKVSELIIKGFFKIIP